MALFHFHFLSLFLFILIVIFSSGPRISESARVFTMINSCKETVWPGITPGDNFNGGGFPLQSGQSIVFKAPVGWSGRIWGRTGCNFDKNGVGTCQTGRCGSALQCKASGQGQSYEGIWRGYVPSGFLENFHSSETPATLAEFTLATLDFYDVSLVDGFNLPMTVTPLNGKGNCSIAGCDGDLRLNCPAELSLKSKGKTIACRSACDVFNTDEYCCRGIHGNPSTCKPTFYSKKFKEVCPTSYSYAYDDPSSIFTCSGTDYVITFCAPRKQPVCTYHNNKLVCSGSNGLKSFICTSWLVMLAIVLMVNWWIISP